MGRNRVLGSPFQPAVITTDTTTQHQIDQYLVDAPLGRPVTITLDPRVVQGDQVVVQDVANNAETQHIVVDASPSQTIVGVGDSISVTTNGGGVQLTYDQDLGGWVATVLTLGPGGGGAIDNVFGAAPIVSSGGVSPTISITAATDAAAGSMSAADKTKLDGITAGAAVASVSGTAPIVSSGGGTPAISITAATDVAAGSMSAADKTKLDSITPGIQTLVTLSAAISAASLVKGTRYLVTAGPITQQLPIAGLLPGLWLEFTDATGVWATGGTHNLSLDAQAGNLIQDPNYIGISFTTNQMVTLSTVGATFRVTWNGTLWQSE